MAEIRDAKLIVIRKDNDMKYSVSGMGCAACQARVEKAVAEVEGVTEVAVSLLTNSMNVEGTASPEAVIKAVEDAGYGASCEEDASPF